MPGARRDVIKLQIHHHRHHKKLQTVTFDEQIKDEQIKGRTTSGVNRFWDEHSQVTKVLCIIAPTECYIAGIHVFSFIILSFLMIDALIQFILMSSC